MNEPHNLSLKDLTQNMTPEEIAETIREITKDYSNLYIQKSEDCLPNKELAGQLYNMNLLADFFEGKLSQ